MQLKKEATQPHISWAQSNQTFKEYETCASLRNYKHRQPKVAS